MGVELSRILAGRNHAPVVYFAQMGGHVKIGTTTNLVARMQSFYLSLADVVLIVPGARKLENAYHTRFQRQRVGGRRRELFVFSGELRQFLSAALPDFPELRHEPRMSVPPGCLTIRQAADAGMIPSTWGNPSGAFGTLKNRAKREGRPVPEVKAMKGNAAVYDAVELADFIERETSKERQPA
jgi:hypothetical protein